MAVAIIYSSLAIATMPTAIAAKPMTIVKIAISCIIFLGFLAILFFQEITDGFKCFGLCFFQHVVHYHYIELVGIA